MSWLKNLSARGKLFIGFGTIWLLLASVVVVAYLAITNVTEYEREMYDVFLKRILAMEELRARIHYGQGQMLELSMTDPGEVFTSTLANLRKSGQQSLEAIDAILNQSANHPYRAKLLALKAEIADMVAERVKLIGLLGQGKIDEARRIMIGAQDARYEKIRALMAEIRQGEESGLVGRIERDGQYARSVVQAFLIMGALAFLLALVMILVLNKLLISPLLALANLAQRISSGDLTAQMPQEDRHDEVGRLAASFSDMTANLRQSTGQIAATINQLSAATSQILTASSQVASSTSETASAISETTTTVKEVRQAAQLSSKKAQEVSSGAQAVAQVSQGGRKAVDEAARGMLHIRQEMESIAKTVVYLSEQGQSIGGIIATITDLADQSNLLAVNAAIEAAKAGEHGRGFAVVAQEIKSLAEQSKQATTQVRTILGDVQRATSSAVMATEQGSKAVEAGVRQSEQASQAIEALTQSTTEAAQAATQIAVSSQQQVVGMDQVGLAMENINQAGSQTAVSMKQVETAARSINEQGKTLQQMVQRYTV